MALRIGLLGPLVVWSDGRELEVGRGRQRALLALLALRAGAVVPVDQLVEDLWEGKPPATVQKVLQGYVSHLRRTLGAEAIFTRNGSYELRATTDVQDLEGRHGAAALELWRGEPLVEFAYETWAQSEIQRLNALRLVAVEERIDNDLRRGETGGLVPELEALIEAHPLRERLSAQLMVALYRTGRQADALRVYADARRALVDELGVEPGPELQETQRRILSHDPELGRPPRSWATTMPQRSRALVGIGFALLAAAAVAGGVLLARGAGPAARGDALALVAPTGRTVSKRASFAAPQSVLAIGSGFIWTLGGDNGTVTAIDARSHAVLGTFSVPGRPVDLTYGDDSFWVLTQGPASLIRLDPRSHATTQTIELHDLQPDPLHHRPGQRSLAYARGLLFAIDGAGNAFRIDPQTRAATRLDLSGAASVVAADGFIWIGNGTSPGTAQVARVAPVTGRVTAETPVPTTVLSSFAVGGGALWVPDLFTGEVWQVRGRVIRATSIGPGVSSVAFSNGAAWVGNDVTDTLSKIDPASARVTTVVPAAAPQEIAATPDGPLVLTGPTASPDALPPSACAPLQTGGAGTPRFIVASDLDVHGAPLIATISSAAVQDVLRTRHYRAGRYTVGYQACDDSSPLAQSWDAARCDANATLYAKTRKLIGIIGPTDSGCAGEELPILNEAPGGPVALVSPEATFDFLTRTTPGVAAGMLQHLYPTHIRNFVRVVPAEAQQVAAAALLAHQLGLHRVAIVADQDGTVVTPAHVAWFQFAARKLHISTVVVSTAAASGVRADGVFIASDAVGRGGGLIATLRARRGNRFPVIGTDYLAPTDQIRAAGASTNGTYIVTGSTLSKRQIAASARNAANDLLDAIATSNGTRLSVVQQLHTSGHFQSNGDPARPAVSVLRISDSSDVPDPEFANTILDGTLTPPRRITHP